MEDKNIGKPELIEFTYESQSHRARRLARRGHKKFNALCRWLRARPWSTVTISVATIAYTVFAGGQWLTMSLQLREMSSQRRDTETQLRAILTVIDPTMFPYSAKGQWLKKGEEGVAGWSVSPGWKNTGGTVAEDVWWNFELKWYRIEGPESDAQRIATCPAWPSLKGHGGITIPPGDQNGVVAEGEWPATIRTFG